MHWRARSIRRAQRKSVFAPSDEPVRRDAYRSLHTHCNGVCTAPARLAHWITVRAIGSVQIVRECGERIAPNNVGHPLASAERRVPRDVTSADANHIDAGGVCGRELRDRISGVLVMRRERPRTRRRIRNNGERRIRNVAQTCMTDVEAIIGIGAMHFGLPAADLSGCRGIGSAARNARSATNRIGRRGR